MIFSSYQIMTPGYIYIYIGPEEKKVAAGWPFTITSAKSRHETGLTSQGPIQIATVTIATGLEDPAK